MRDDSADELQGLIDRLTGGDEDARLQLLERATARMRRLTAAMLQQSFPALERRHEVDSILHDAWLRLHQALAKVHPPTVADFFRLVAHKVRQVLLDLADRQRRLVNREVRGLAETESATPLDPSQHSADPARLAVWTEFHERVASLPDDQKQIFELHYYLGLTQAEVARVLELHPRKVSYLWIAATERLAVGLVDPDSLF